MKRLLAALLALLLLSACSAKVPTRKIPAPAELPTAAATGPSVVRVLSVPGDPTLDVLISAYYGKYANARVDKVAISSATSVAESFRQKLVEGAADVVPLVGGANVWIAGMMEGNTLLPLDPYIQKSKFDMQPFGALPDQLRIGGQLYELPYMSISPMIVYNEGMFSAAGLPLPKEGWTWEQFREAARKLTRGEGEGKVWGFSSTSSGLLARQWFYGRPTEDWRTDEKVLREGLQFFATMLFTDKAVTPANRADGSSFAFRDEFWQGKAAMTLESAGFSGAFRNASLKYGYAPFPVMPGEKPVTAFDPYTLAIAANAQNPDAAWQFVQFACGPEGAAALAKAGYRPIHNTPEVKNAYAMKQPAPPPGWEAMFNTNWKMAPRTGHPLYPLEVRAQQMINQVMSGAKEWENALPEYLREAETLKPKKN